MTTDRVGAAAHNMPTPEKWVVGEPAWKCGQEPHPWWRILLHMGMMTYFGSRRSPVQIRPPRPENPSTQQGFRGSCLIPENGTAHTMPTPESRVVGA